MKQILITAATLPELTPFISFLELKAQQIAPYTYQLDHYKINILVTGVGMMQSAFVLGDYLAHQSPNMCIQIGIAGTYHQHWKLGDVVAIASEQYGDLGAEDNDAYIDMHELALIPPNQAPFAGGQIQNRHIEDLNISLPLVKSLSVNTVSGSLKTISFRKKRYACDIENMEGIAFHYACTYRNIPYLQIRGLSNYVEPRNRNNWQIGPAIEAVNEELKNLISTL